MIYKYIANKFLKKDIDVLFVSALLCTLIALGGLISLAIGLSKEMDGNRGTASYNLIAIGLGGFAVFGQLAHALYKRGSGYE